MGSVHTNPAMRPAMLTTLLTVHQGRVPPASSGAAGAIKKQTEYQGLQVSLSYIQATSLTSG